MTKENQGDVGVVCLFIYLFLFIFKTMSHFAAWAVLSPLVSDLVVMELQTLPGLAQVIILTDFSEVMTWSCSKAAQHVCNQRIKERLCIHSWFSLTNLLEYVVFVLVQLFRLYKHQLEKNQREQKPNIIEIQKIATDWHRATYFPVCFFQMSRLRISICGIIPSHSATAPWVKDDAFP